MRGGVSKRVVCGVLFGLMAIPPGSGLVAQQATSAPPAKPAAEARDEAGAAEILEKHIAALGGREKLRQIRSIEREAELEIFGTATKTYLLTDRETRRFYQRSEGQQGLVEAGYDGKRLWRKSPSFRGYLPETDPAYRRFQQPEVNLVEYKESGRKYFRLPDEKLGDALCYVVEGTIVMPARGEAPIKYYFDATTLMIRQTVAGADITTTTVFEEYRQVDGFWAAHKMTIKGPNQTSTQRVTRIRHNVAYDAAVFDFKEGATVAATAAATSPAEAAKAEPPAAAAPATPPASARPAATTGRFQPGDLVEEPLRMDTFELIWKTVEDTYWDRSFGGVNWKGIHDKYLARVKQAATSEEFHRLMNQMVGELDRSHFRVHPPDRVAGLNTRAADLRNGSVGLGLKWLGGQLVVDGLQNGYPAEAAGIRKGYAVQRINGKTSAEMLAESDRKNPGFQLREELRRTRSAGEELAGRPGEKVSLEMLNEKDEVVTYDLARKEVPIGVSLLEFESRRLEGDIGYIRMSIFFGDAVERFREALRQLANTRGLIVDLRGNPGGVGVMGPTIASSLCRKPGSLGTLQFRYEKQEYKWESAKNVYPGRVVILVDSDSGSASEVFAGGLQELGCATIVGETTAGAVLPSTMKALPTGGALQHVVSDFRTPKGIQLEGRGVIPDVNASPTRAALLEGRDVALECAVELARKPSSFGKRPKELHQGIAWAQPREFFTLREETSTLSW